MQHVPQPAFALEIHGLIKRFDRPAVDDLELNVRAGEFYALLGPNGAGKTTTLRMIAGLLRPDAGTIRVMGIDALADPVAAKRLMAWISDEPMIYDKLTPMEYLEFVAGLWAVEACGYCPDFRPRHCGGRRRRRCFGHLDSGLVSHPSEAQPIAAAPKFVDCCDVSRSAVVV